MNQPCVAYSHFSGPANMLLNPSVNVISSLTHHSERYSGLWSQSCI